MCDADSIIERDMKNEQEAYDFYTNLSRLVENKEAKDTLLYLTREEKGHKEKLEYLYANAAFTQTAGG